jgi:hypothetical protein
LRMQSVFGGFNLWESWAGMGEMTFLLNKLGIHCMNPHFRIPQ